MVGEVSGDTLGVKLMQSFREQGIDAEFEGIGGPQMIAEGFKSYYPMEILSVMGIVEVLKDLKKLFAVRDGLVELWTAQPVDVFIVPLAVLKLRNPIHKVIALNVLKPKLNVIFAL